MESGKCAVHFGPAKQIAVLACHAVQRVSPLDALHCQRFTVVGMVPCVVMVPWPRATTRLVVTSQQVMSLLQCSVRLGHFLPFRPSVAYHGVCYVAQLLLAAWHCCVAITHWLSSFMMQLETRQAISSWSLPSDCRLPSFCTKQAGTVPGM